MSKLSRISVPAALACAAVLIGAAATPAHAGLSVLNGLPTINTMNPNALSATGASAALKYLNGVAVEAVVLPPEPRR